MRDERAGIGRVAGLPAQRHLERRQRTDHPEPCLHDDHAYCREMGNSKPPVAHPRPVERPAREYEDEPGNDEGYEQGVQY